MPGGGVVGAAAARAARVQRPPSRSCVACRTAREKRDLLRVVRAPDGTVGLDSTGRLNGRGAYVCRDGACISNAIDRGLLGRALEVAIPASLGSELSAAANDLMLSGGDRGTE